MKIVDIARVCHEANRAFCAGIGDNSQEAWEDAPQWKIDSAISTVNFILENPDAPVSYTHDSWSSEKLAAGWKYGPVKDATLKEHPCLVPYNQLPKVEQAKDYLFRAIVLNLAMLLD